MDNELNGSGIIYEPSSTRRDGATLIITASNPCVIPFYFNIPIKSTNGETYEDTIKAEDKLVFVFKESQRFITPVLRKEYTNIIENTVFLSLTPEDIRLFYGNRNYNLGCTWYDSDGNIKRILITNLPIKVKGVVQDV